MCILLFVFEIEYLKRSYISLELAMNLIIQLFDFPICNIINVNKIYFSGSMFCVIYLQLMDVAVLVYFRFMYLD